MEGLGKKLKDEDNDSDDDDDSMEDNDIQVKNEEGFKMVLINKMLKEKKKIFRIINPYRQTRQGSICAVIFV